MPNKTEKPYVLRAAEFVYSNIIEIKKQNNGFEISFWDGYALSESQFEDDEGKVLKILKTYVRKLAKNLRKT